MNCFFNLLFFEMFTTLLALFFPFVLVTFGSVWVWSVAGMLVEQLFVLFFLSSFGE